MLFVNHWEVDFEKGLGSWKELNEKWEEEIINHPEKYPKYASDVWAYVGEPHKGFQVMEADNPDQLTRFALLFVPYIKCEVKPIAVEQTKLWFEYIK